MSLFQLQFTNAIEYFIEAGDLVLARYAMDNLVYRARVESLDSHNVTVNIKKF